MSDHHHRILLDGLARDIAAVAQALSRHSEHKRRDGQWACTCDVCKPIKNALRELQQRRAAPEPDPCDGPECGRGRPCPKCNTTSQPPQGPAEVSRDSNVLPEGAPAASRDEQADPDANRRSPEWHAGWEAGYRAAHNDQGWTTLTQAREQLHVAVQRVKQAEMLQAQSDARALTLAQERNALEAELDQARKELEAEHETSRNDPAEQRAERYADEAADLIKRLIEAEAALAVAQQERDEARAVHMDPTCPCRNCVEAWNLIVGLQAERDTLQQSLAEKQREAFDAGWYRRGAHRGRVRMPPASVREAAYAAWLGQQATSPEPKA